MWRLIGTLVAIAVVALAVAFAVFDDWLDSPYGGEVTSIEIAPGEPLASIAERLARRGVLSRPAWFRWYARLTQRAARVHVGEYSILPTHTPRQLLDDFVTGRVVEHTLQLIEGWTLGQAMSAMRARGDLRFDLDDAAIDNPLASVEAQYGSAEGWLFPDTYRYRKGDRASALVAIAHERMKAVLAAEWSERAGDLPYETPYEALIAASIIEKETGLDSDRPLIARVFASRLALGMRLQSDPTVIYGLGDRFDGNLTRAHLREQTPYNSYRRAGLPPTPIALPGLASIRAALHPADGKYLYFVSRGDGSSEFSATLEEHNAAVRRYQLETER